MKLLFGNYEITIDDKNRMLVPAEIRRAIDPETDGEAFYMSTGVNGRAWLWPEKHYERLAEGRESKLSPELDDVDFDHLSFGLATRLEWDKQGRVLIPEKSLRKTGLRKEVTLVAARNHVEIWNREEWSAREEELERRRAEIAARAR